MPSMIRKLWKRADGQRSIPCLFREIMWTKAGKTKTRAKPHVAPENLQKGRQRVDITTGDSA